MTFVDSGRFSELFEELGWGGVPGVLQAVSAEGAEGGQLTARPIADQYGLRVWVVECDRIPNRTDQRAIDSAVQRTSSERLLIFTDGVRQVWSWPRSGATAATNHRLLNHRYEIGDEEQREDLLRRLKVIDLMEDAEGISDTGITSIQQRMVRAFNEEAIKRSQQASGHMKVMNQTLLDAGCDTDTASSLLARLLFLFFGDDTGMWDQNTFQNWVQDHTNSENIHEKITELFDVLCDPELDKAGPHGVDGGGEFQGTEFERFRRIDGMYKEKLDLPSLNGDFRVQVLRAGDFDWSKVNPDIFGAMFQQLVDPAQLRQMGEHYTSEENIQKVIDPMFLDQLREKFEAAKGDRKALLSLQDEIASLQFLDPACGCGNFLIQAYKHLRSLEFEIIRAADAIRAGEIREELDGRERKTEAYKRLIAELQEIEQGSMQLGTKALQRSKMSMQQFFGIEINRWPAAVASTAMLLVDHLCNQAWGENAVRLPIEETPNIVCANALRTDWEEVVPDTEKYTYVFGNPPFIGKVGKSKIQIQEMKDVWGNNYDGYLDYVTAWHAKSKGFLADRPGEFAFVTTNSITQGQPVPKLFGPLLKAGWHIKFAHRTFPWESDAPGRAVVHCAIIGFTNNMTTQRLWEYDIKSKTHEEIRVTHGVNPYLIDGPNLTITREMQPLSPEIRSAVCGCQPTDNGNLIVDAGAYDEVSADKIAKRYLRPFTGSRELTQGIKRWCLWLEDCTQEEIQSSPILRYRVEANREFREGSKEGSEAWKIRRTPHLFRINSLRPTADYLCIPSVVSANRKYFTAQQFPGETISSNLAFNIEDPTGLSFSLVSSSMFITWQRAIGGRMKSDLRFASTLTWNTFPVPELDDDARQEIIEAGKGILAARELFPDRSLAEHYRPGAEDPQLLAAHDVLDVAVDKAFGAEGPLTAERERLEILFARYAEMTGQ
ncbi:SAM-dependent DNA methyltransferase [Corynebacterium sputi]|uniref:SAM-dependent DNA methyltransferase n=1 Tax=Corynebacterium sputi TaxID=489915 RepID=UPI001969AB8A|nr:SAM-dependent DNA methyltransferase [Corynebacterium sputi]